MQSKKYNSLLSQNKASWNKIKFMKKKLNRNVCEIEKSKKLQGLLLLILNLILLGSAD